MNLRDLTLTHYRNYEELSLRFDGPIHLFIGNNAQGKTNVLESIYVLALAKSHRTARDKELIAWNADYATIRSEVERRYGSVRLEIQLTSKGKRAKINGIEQSKLSEYIGALNVVMFAPEDLAIVKGAPAQRRRFIDMEIGQVSPTYLYYLSSYNRVLAQKNQLLKDMAMKKGQPHDEAMLSIWNTQLADLAVKLLKKRFEFLGKLEAWAREIHSGITDGKETLSLHYENSSPVTAGMEAAQAQEAMLAAYEEMFEREKQRGSTLIGPHRDDFSLRINNMDVQTYGSQGQQRTSALSLKLAEIELIKEEVGEYPVLLLDDVLSELDEHRQTLLLETIQNKVQTFVSTTGVEGLKHQVLRQASRYYVREGKISLES
ncbi:DNA replication/repair protein RecF [Brevibacillus sp. SYP-B805]|uniref:DNA replication/repair protein RecF n=1 Tax=Brevibacillus sp. SYP-B805 TaxID=1578199 RepID=UPI0013EDE5E0|nr:DNA replication/repair protein RecF [Brevibacillus sp. SYP-B805]NGQ96549.1 DNA replication/repair protein RecF [Brevibacillus sp. SYP-B805]